MLANSLRLSWEAILPHAEARHLYNPLKLQCIRWRRKPRWLPVAPSKLFRVPVRRRMPPEENAEYLTLKNHYRTAMKSLRTYFMQKTQESLTGVDIIAELKRVEDEEYQRSLELNTEWNKKVSLVREQRLAKEKEEQLERIMQSIEESKTKAQQRKEELEALVRKEKELSKYYITPENIDEAIENALSTVVDHNFSIDLYGNVFRGKKTKPDS